MREESAGGFVFPQRQQKCEILLIKDRYGYWTFPKGKKERDESDEQTALREIVEETQIEGEIKQRLDVTEYLYQHPVHGEVLKRVTCFLVEAIQGKEKAQLEEIVDVGWYSLTEAERLLHENGYQNDLHLFQLAKKALSMYFFPSSDRLIGH